jgi:hypothetical protein
MTVINDPIQDYADFLTYVQQTYVYKEGTGEIIRIPDLVEFNSITFNECQDGQRLSKLHNVMSLTAFEIEREAADFDKRRTPARPLSAWKLVQDTLNAVTVKISLFSAAPVVDHEVGGITHSCLNVWRPSSLEPADPFEPADADPWVNHVRAMLGEQAGEMLLNWFAWIVQHPDMKVRWAPIIYSEQGTGKDMMIGPIHSIFGRHNTTDLDGQILSNQFNDYDGKKFLIVNELKNNSRWDTYEKLKPKISGNGSGMVRINEKGEKPYWVPNVSAWIVFTNNRGAMAIDPLDRRFYVIHGSFPVALVDRAEYFARLAHWLRHEDGDAKVYAYLIRRQVDLTDFNQSVPPAGNAAKNEMAYDAMTEQGKWVNDAISCGAFADRQIIVRKEVDRLADMEGVTGLTDWKMDEGMRGAGLVNLGSHPLAAGRTGQRKGKSTWFVRGDLLVKFGATWTPAYRDVLYREMPAETMAKLGLLDLAEPVAPLEATGP